MNIAVIDAEIIGKNKHRFPNLALMKISGYHKSIGDNVVFKTNYNELSQYDTVYVSKVFTDTPIDIEILEYKNVKYGGTGFFYDKAESLPDNIEHHMPDYDLYKNWVDQQISDGKNKIDFKYYTDYSIGFTTRGCFRHCSFCVNQRFSKVTKHSDLSEFVDEDRKYICLLDDNILGYSNWKTVFDNLKNSKKYFEYKQGMDIRILNDEKAKVLSTANYKCNNGFMFAFDSIKDKEMIIEKLKIWRKYYNKTTKMYVLCAYDEYDKYDESFWINDIKNTFERIFVLMQYGCIPYIMRYNKYLGSPYEKLYTAIAGWCNNPREFMMKPFSAFYKKYKEFNLNIPKHYWDMNYEDINNFPYSDTEDLSKWKIANSNKNIHDINREDIKSKSIDIIVSRNFDNILFEKILKNKGFAILEKSKFNNFDNRIFSVKKSTENYLIIGFSDNYDTEKYLDHYSRIRDYIKRKVLLSEYKYSSQNIIDIFSKINNITNPINARQRSQQRLNYNYNQFTLMTETEYLSLSKFFNFDIRYNDLLIIKNEDDETYERIRKNNKIKNTINVLDKISSQDSLIDIIKKIQNNKLIYFHDYEIDGFEDIQYVNILRNI